MKKIIFLICFILLVACSNQINTEVKPGNEGFIIGNGSTAVLLTHGLSSSPYEEKLLAEYLAEKNLTVYVLRLPGHGTNLDDLSRTTWEDWYKAYHDAYLSLKENKQNVFIGGMSLGGILALKLAEDEKVDGIIALAPSLILDDERAKYSWLFKYFTKYSLRNISVQDAPYNYDKFSVASVAEMLDMSDVVQKDLKKINEPVFLMQYKQDYRVNPESSQIVYDSISSEKKELNWINGTGHVMISSPEKEEYFQMIYNFIKKND